MKDSRIFPFKLRAENDNLISAGACRLILRICSWRSEIKFAPADAEFALSWSDIARWYDDDDKQPTAESIGDKETIYRWLRELVFNKYLYYNGRKGCPAVGCYRLTFHFPEPLVLFVWAANRKPLHAHMTLRDGILIEASVGGKTHQLVGGKTHQLVGGKTPPQVGGKNRPPHISYSLREEKITPKGKKCQAGFAGKGDEGGRKSSALRAKDGLTGEALLKFMATCRKDAGV